MKYMEYFIYDKNGKSNCVIRSLCKVYNMEYDNVYNELCTISKKLNCESFNDILVLETFMKERNTLPIECKDIKIKNLELDNGNYLVFCWDKKDFYHMVPIMNNTIYDRDKSSLDLYIITLYKENNNMTYDDLLKFHLKHGTTKEDIVVSMGYEKIEENVIIAPWWEHVIFDNLGFKIEQVSEYVYNFYREDLSFSYIEVKNVGASRMMDFILPLGVTVHLDI